MADEEANTFYLEEVSIDEEDIDQLEYDEVPEDEDDDDDDEEDFGAVLNSLKNRQDSSASVPSPSAGRVPRAKSTEPGASAPPRAGIVEKPTVMDDFIRNFLIKLNMSRTLDAFNTEWYEMKDQGQLNPEDVGDVSDLYQKNEGLDDQVKLMREEVIKAHEVAEKARGTWDKFRKERDFHRMHHRRVVQEKNMLIRDMKRLQKHYSTFEPALKAMRQKYDLCMKEKTMVKLERDRLTAKVQALEAQITNAGGDATIKDTGSSRERARAAADGGGRGGRGGGGRGKARRSAAPDNAHKEFNASKRKGEATLPPNSRMNPHLGPIEPINARELQLGMTHQASQMPISGLALHPSKPIVATVSDDMTWMMWSTDTFELIMKGEGHKNWIGACEFHPGGGLLATASGDSTVKLWNFAAARCTATFTDHHQAVWDCAFHDKGDFLVSASQDQTCRVFDVGTGRSRQTIRGHVDSINSVKFQPYTNNVVTGSADKTVSLWDIRSGHCIQTFYGHDNAVLSAVFSLQGDTIASGDADGVIKLWDVRMVQERGERQVGSSVNDLKFDRSGKVVIAALDDSTVKAYELVGGDVVDLAGHQGAVQAVAVDPRGDYIMSAGSDCTIRKWER